MNERASADHSRTTLPTVEEFARFPSYRRELYRRYSGGLYPPDDELPPAPDSPHARAVYFVQAADGSIKIGQAWNVEKRIASLQTAHAHPLKLLATTRDTFASEAMYHRLFAEHRLHGEWFRPHREVLAEIRRLNRLARKVERETDSTPFQGASL